MLTEAILHALGSRGPLSAGQVLGILLEEHPALTRAEVEATLDGLRAAGRVSLTRSGWVVTKVLWTTTGLTE